MPATDARPNYLPNFCAPTAVFLLVLISQLLALILTLAQLSTIELFWVELALKSLFIQWVTLCSTALLCLLGKWLSGWHTVTLALLAFTVIQGITALFSGMVVYYAPLLGMHSLLATHEPLLFILRNLGISLIVALLLLRYLSLQQRWRAQLSAEASSQLQALQARIRPHFLFNSLNTIAHLIRKRPAQAEEAVLDLADLFRASLRESDHNTLAQELDIIRRYLHLETLRLGERLQIDWQLAEDIPLDMQLPALILQPLVENAVLHGIQSLSTVGVLTISLSRHKHHLRVEIHNPLNGGTHNLHRWGSGTAQLNVRRRLALAYGEHARMNVRQSATHYTVSLHLPIHYVDA